MMSVKSAAGLALVDDTRVIANVEPMPPRAMGPDVFRALAILLVMLWHLPRPATLESLVGLKQYAWAGVDIFFVLSGYLIGRQLLEPLAQGRPISLSNFYLKRALRILPAFLVVLSLYVFLPALREAPEMKPAWRFLTFTMNFGLDYRVTGAFTQAWSLCVEEHFYLLLPVLVLLLSRLRRRGWALLVIGTVLFWRHGVARSACRSDRHSVAESAYADLASARLTAAASSSNTAPLRDTTHHHRHTSPGCARSRRSTGPARRQCRPR